MKQMNFSKIKQDLNTLLGTYRGKRHDNYIKARYPLLYQQDTETWIGLGEEHPLTAALPHFVLGCFITSAVCLVGYKIFGHTNKARVQPIKTLLNMVNYIEFTLANFIPSEDRYWQRLAYAHEILLKRTAEITAYRSESNEYKQLTAICDHLLGFLEGTQAQQGQKNLIESDSINIVCEYLRDPVSY